MKQIINGKLYNTATMTTLCQKSSYNNGNYCGDATIRVTAKGNYALVITSNGQDLYRDSSIEAINKSSIAVTIDGWRLDENEVELLAAHGVIVDA